MSADWGRTRISLSQVGGRVLGELVGATGVAEVVGDAAVFAGRGRGGRIDAHAANRILRNVRRGIAHIRSHAVAVMTAAAVSGAHRAHVLGFLLGLVIAEQSHDRSFPTVLVAIIFARIGLAYPIRLVFRRLRVRIEQAQRLAFVTTHNDENAIAAPAIIGFSSIPVNGYSTPAAIAMPMLL